MLLQAFVWEEYANHKSKYNPISRKYDKVKNSFRISYPTPKITQEELLDLPPDPLDSEMMFIFKLFHGNKYKDK